MKYLLLGLSLLVLLTGCFSPPTPRFSDPDTQNYTLDFNPLSFEVIKIWNEKNPELNEIELDECNKGLRKSAYEWLVELHPCVPVKQE